VLLLHVVRTRSCSSRRVTCSRTARSRRWSRTGDRACSSTTEPDLEASADGTRVRLRGERVLESSRQLEHRSIDYGAFLLPVEVFDAQRRAAAR
jgi:hypothetical protein